MKLVISGECGFCRSRFATYAAGSHWAPAAYFSHGDRMKAPSSLGSAIEAAIERDGRFRRHREPVQYLCCYRTTSGRVFAIERVTKTQIRLWFPADESVRLVAENDGLTVTKREPHAGSADGARYGRISSLKSIPELRDAILYTTAAKSPAQAMAVVGALK